MPSPGIGAKLQQARLGLGLTVADLSRDTRIASKFLEAIESGNLESLPGRLFARNFVRQYALAVNLDPQPFLAELPKQEELRLPDPPATSSYPAMRSAFSSGIWLVLAAGAATAAYLHFNHPAVNQPVPSQQAVTQPAVTKPKPVSPPAVPVVEAPAAAPIQPAPEAAAPPAATPEHPVRVVITALKSAWVQVSADGKTAFTGTLAPSQTKEVSADSLVKIFTGNAGGLTVSLNGKTLDPLGPVGQIRVVRLTAEGQQSLSKAPTPAPDPL